MFLPKSARLPLAAALATFGAAVFSSTGYAADELGSSSCGGSGAQICERVCTGFWIWKDCNDVKYWSQEPE